MHAFDATKVRGFSFWRFASPANRMNELLTNSARQPTWQKAQGMRLVIENEETCNAATGHEIAVPLAKAPASNLGSGLGC